MDKPRLGQLMASDEEEYKMYLEAHFTNFRSSDIVFGFFFGTLEEFPRSFWLMAYEENKLMRVRPTEAYWQPPLQAGQRIELVQWIGHENRYSIGKVAEVTQDQFLLNDRVISIDSRTLWRIVQGADYD